MGSAVELRTGYSATALRRLIRKRWGGRPLDGIYVPEWLCWNHQREEASMEKITIIGLDLAKRSIQIHAAGAEGAVLDGITRTDAARMGGMD